MRYPKYKDSGIDWIGEIPEGWEVKRIKDIGSLGSGATPKTENPLYYDGDIPWINTGSVQNSTISSPSKYITNLALEECPGLCYYPKNTLLVAMYGGGTIGNVGYLTFPSTINQACCAITPNKNHNTKYLFYLLISKKSWIISNGFGGTQINLSRGQIENFLFSFPPLFEQQAIADYLDKKTAEIDGQVELLEKKVEKYEQLKKSLISRTVTRGLNKDVRLKDSGIDWIGEIPEGWEVKRIKDIGSLGSGATPKTENPLYYDGDIPWINTGSVQDSTISSPSKYITNLALEECPGLCYYPKNTLLVAMYGGGTIGNVGYLTFPSTINQACCAITPNKNHNTKYLFYLLISKKSWIISNGFGGTQINLSRGQIENFLFSFPPLFEQQAIADYLDQKISEIDTAIAQTKQQIENYKKLRKSLINEVVTGQRQIEVQQ